MHILILIITVISTLLTATSSLLIPHDTDVSWDKLSMKELEHLSNDPVVTHTVKFEISKRVKGELYTYGNTIIIGDLTLGLFGITTPITVANFIHLSNMTFGYGYKDVIFHRVIENFMIQGGDFNKGDGTGGHSIYNDGKFDDENPKAVEFDKKGRLAMANLGPNTNGAQFFISTNDDLSYLNGIHVIFGQLIDGFDTLNVLNKASTDTDDKPVNDIFVSNIIINDFKIKSELTEGKLADALYADVSVVNKPDQNGKHDKTIALNTEDLADTLPMDETSLLKKYKYLFIACFIAASGFGIRSYYGKQYITDIKDTDYF